MSKNHFLPFQMNTIIFIFVIFLQNGCRRPFWMSKAHFRWHFWPFQINGHFRSIRNGNFDKMAAVGYFGCPKFTFDRISDHFRSIRNFFFFLQNGRRCPFWMSEIHFRSHFWPFQIDTQLHFYWKFLKKWLPSAILDVRNSLSIAFLAIVY